MERQFVVAHTIRRTEIPALLDSWVTNTPSLKMLCPQKKKISLYVRQNVIFLSDGLLTFRRRNFLLNFITPVFKM